MRARITLAGSLPKLGAALLLVCGNVAATAGGAETATPNPEVARGRELFLREWLPDDPRAHGGDGLGPVYNDSSCVACHGIGGPGGGGPSSKDVVILSAFAPAKQSDAFSGVLGVVGRALFRKAAGGSNPKPADTAPAGSDEALARLHPGFRSARSVVLHRSSSDPGYPEWRRGVLAAVGSSQMPKTANLSKRDAAKEEIMQHRLQILTSFATSLTPGEFAGFQVTVSRRNTPPLFGAGLIDAIPDRVIEAGAEKPDAMFPETKGRVSRLDGGQIGRFGWKGQTTSLKEFVLTACAVELGLEVPGHAQGSIPTAAGYRPPGLDLDESECASLEAYVRSLPAPTRREPGSEREAATIRAGEGFFHAIGCVACHVPKLGDVPNLYSDLLLHDMGESLSDSGTYNVFVNESPMVDARKDGEGADAKARKGAERREWRTPPLWGFRDSGPYLHDGRAENLEQAVAFHDGQAARSAEQFFMLSPRQRLKVEAFLKSLAAPVEPAKTGG